LDETTVTSTIPERLLALGADFARYHDALHGVGLLRSQDPAAVLAQQATAAQALAREALDLRDATATAGRLYRSPDISAAVGRTNQLAALSLSAADQLIDASPLLQTAAGQKDAHRPDPVPREVGVRIALAAELVSLGAVDCLEAAGLIAHELYRQNLGFGQRPPSLSPTQHAALKAVASGSVTLRMDKPYVWRGDARVTSATSAPWRTAAT